MSKKNKNKKHKSKKKVVAQKPELVVETKIFREEPLPKEEPVASFWLNKKIHILLIFAISFGIYTNTINHKYAVDDAIVILRNNFTKKGLKGMPGIWKEDVFTGFFGKAQNLVAGGRYRPLSIATFALEMEIWGTPILNKDGTPVLDKDKDIIYNGNPKVTHFINILLYAILCVVIYLMLLQMFNPKGEQDNFKAYFIALVGGLLYATHPIHTEAVANIKGRDEIMVLLGAVLAVYWVLKAAVNKGSKEYLYLLAAMLAFVFSIFSKENTVTFLAIIPAALFFFTPTKMNKIVAYTLPFLVIVLVFWFGIRANVLGEAAAVIGSETAVELMNDPFLKLENGFYVPYSAEERLATVFYTWLEYIRLLVYPVTLTNDYYPKHIRTDLDLIPTFAMGKVMLSVVLHMALVAFMLKGTFQKKAYAFFILFYFATFSVVSNLLFTIGSNMAERFLFLPSVAFSALCAILLYELVLKIAAKKSSITKALNLPVAILAVFLVLYSVKTYARNFAWYDDYTLFTTDIKNSPHSAKLNNATSGVVQEHSKYTTDIFQRKAELEQALFYAERAIQLHPAYSGAFLLRGNAHTYLAAIHQQLGMQANNAKAKQEAFTKSLESFNSAISSYKEVLRWKPKHRDIKQNLPLVLRNKGKLLGQFLRNADASIEALEESLQWNDKDFETLRLLGIAYGMKGKQLENINPNASYQYSLKAVKLMKKVLELAPNGIQNMYNLEVAHRALNLPQEADKYRAMWQAIDPNYDPLKEQ